MQRTQKPWALCVREGEGMSQCVQLYLAARTRVEGKLLDKEAPEQQQEGTAARHEIDKNSCMILVSDYFCLGQFLLW